MSDPFFMALSHIHFPDRIMSYKLFQYITYKYSQWLLCQINISNEITSNKLFQWHYVQKILNFRYIYLNIHNSKVFILGWHYISHLVYPVYLSSSISSISLIQYIQYISHPVDEKYIVLSIVQ